MKADAQVRHTALEKLYPCWPPWRPGLAPAARRVGDTAPSPGELVANDCFGRVASASDWLLKA